MAPILRLDGVVAGYGAGDILKGVDLCVEPGTVTCLIGPNGAGKSTVLKTISGLLRPSGGRVVSAARTSTDLRPKARLLLGIVHVPQERSLFPAMTRLGQPAHGRLPRKDARPLRPGWSRPRQAFPICRDRAAEPPGRCPAANRSRSSSPVR